MHSEWLNVGAALCQQIEAAHARGGRVVAVGTTVVRALESSLREGQVRPFAGETRLFLFPGRKIHAVDALVSAFAGKERVMAAYEHAVRERYRFFSYGDAMLIFPDAATRRA